MTTTMSAYRLPPRTASYESTVKCSTCGLDVPLIALADHVCPNPTYDQQSNDPYQTNEPQPFHPPRRGASLFRRAQPTFPLIDSSLPNRGPLSSRDAAEVAYDLGLPSPSPPGAGSGRHSPRPSTTRKTSKRQMTLAPVPAELPLSQDCAFPPFPTMKPKRANTDRDITIKPRSSSRSTNRVPSRSNTFDSSRSQSLSDRVQSPTGTDVITRTTSNSSSELRSRKSTLDGSRSVLSPMPGSPVLSNNDGLASQENFDEPMPTLPVLDASFNISSPDLTSPQSTMIDSMPPALQSSPRKKNQSPFANTYQPELNPIMDDPADDSVVELAVIPATEPEIDPFESPQQERNDPSIAFDTMSPAEQGRQEDSEVNPFPEPSYKPSRPPPVPQSSVEEVPFTFPQSAREPTTPLTAGFGRAITNLFGRKRSRSMTSKGMPKIDLDSPRMRALAPEPPPVPSQYEQDDYFHHSPEPSPPLEARPDAEEAEAIEPPTAAPAHTPAAAGVEKTRELNNEQAKATEISQFDFKFETSIPETIEEGNEWEETTTDGVSGPHQDTKDAEPLFVTSAEPSPASSTQSEVPVQIETQPDNRPIDSSAVMDALRRMSIDSASSYGSVGFTSRTTSSQSSLPPVEEITNIDAVVAESKRDSTATTSIEKVESPIETIQQSPPSPSKTQAPSSPTTIRPPSGRLSIIPEERQAPVRPTLPSPTSSSQEFKVSKSPALPTTEKAAAPPGSKGICRGCSKIILAGQKSVSSKDGRLSGRYHKECFACRTCRSPFATADFYVHDDQPYCAHDYHVINNTLCEACGKGIEGQYLESLDAAGQESKKYHPACLRCATCRCQLDADYFELHGRVYCERDAFRAANGPKTAYGNMPSRPSPLVREYVNSGDLVFKGRFPERRTTRLMMT